MRQGYLTDDASGQNPRSPRHHLMFSCLLGLLAKSSGFSWLQARDRFWIPGCHPPDSIQQYKENYAISRSNANRNYNLRAGGKSQQGWTVFFVTMTVTK